MFCSGSVASKIKGKIQINLELLKEELNFIDQLLQEYLLYEIAPKENPINSFTTSKVRSNYEKALGPRLSSISKKYKLNLKHFDNFSLGCYNLRNIIKKKIAGCEKAIDRPLKDTLRIPKVPLCTKITNREGILYFPNFKTWVGKNETSNQKLFLKNKNKKRYYYHSCVRGGGLTVSINKNNYDNSSLALLYSKNLTTNNTSAGLVSMSENIESVSKIGSFMFYDSIIIKGDYSNLCLCITLSNKQGVIQMVRYTPDLKSNNTKKYFGIITNNKDKNQKRFKSVFSSFTQCEFTSKNVLQYILPYRYDLSKPI